MFVGWQQKLILDYYQKYHRALEERALIVTDMESYLSHYRTKVEKLMAELNKIGKHCYT